MNLRHFGAFLRRHPLMRSLTLGEIARLPDVWLGIIREGV